MIISTLLLASTLALAPSHTVAIPTRGPNALAPRTSKITVTVHNDTAETLELRIGATVTPLAPAQALQLTLASGERIYLDKPAANRPANTILFEAIREFNRADIHFRPDPPSSGLAPTSLL